MAIKEEWLDEVLKGCKTPADITGPNGVIKLSRFFDNWTF